MNPLVVDCVNNPIHTGTIKQSSWITKNTCLPFCVFHSLSVYQCSSLSLSHTYFPRYKSGLIIQVGKLISLLLFSCHYHKDTQKLLVTKQNKFKLFASHLWHVATFSNRWNVFCIYVLTSSNLFISSPLKPRYRT